MYKRIALLLLAFFLVIYICINKTLLFIYLNPYTYTDGFKYIAKPIKKITKVIDEVEKTLCEQGLDIKITYENAYGSGFLKNNPIPNDLDYMIGIDLGEYHYSGNNSEEIAKNISEKISAFKPTFIYHVKNLENEGIYSKESYLTILSKSDKQKIYNSINDYLDKAISGKGYINNSQKLIEHNNKNEIVNIPYMMRPYEILLKDYKPIELFSQGICYYEDSLDYLKEFMIVLEFTFTIKKDGKIYEITIVPESDYGARLQLARKFFVSNTFVLNKSLKFIKKYPAIINDDEYFFYRMFSYRRHLLETENIILTEDRPLKLLKRVMQTADAINPMLDPKLYDEISNFVYINLSNPKIKLLNETSNIIGNIYEIYHSKYLYNTLINSNNFINMDNSLSRIISQFENTNIDKKFIDTLKNFQTEFINPIVLGKDIDLIKYREAQSSLKENINELVVKNYYKKENLNKYMKEFNKIFEDSGYHNIIAYWQDSNNLAIVSDEFTKNIDNFEKFAIQNELPVVNYKLITPNDIKFDKMKYYIRAKYDSSKTEIENSNKLKDILLKDKINFKPKYKLIFLF